MKQDIHPEYNDITATCSCGNVMKIRSTMKKDVNLDVCSACHPFYTGKQRNVDTGGRVDKFKKRFGAISKK
ncbi:MAG: 50S ribosomal protein L31 [Pseudomonadota bacterium]